MSMTRADMSFLRRILDFQLQPLFGIERRQVVEVDLVLGLLRVLEIDRVDLQQREIALAFLRAADLALDGVAGAQRRSGGSARARHRCRPDRQIIGIGRAQEAEAVLQHFDHAFADDLGFARRKLLENGEHQLLLAHGAGVFDLQFLGKAADRSSVGDLFFELRGV
jgi:hypothetical protein